MRVCVCVCVHGECSSECEFGDLDSHSPCLPPPTSPAGDRYWLFREANLEPGYPQPLTSYGLGIPYDRIDTAIWWEPTGHTFFFQEDR